VASFKGKETFTLDPKGRVNIPAKMRKSIPQEAENTFHIMRGMEKCIFAYPINIWNEKYQPMLDKLNPFDPANRQLKRIMYENSEEGTLDAQQRISLPKVLLELAQINEKVTVIGVDDHIEFWNPENYEEYKKKCEDEFEELAAKAFSGQYSND